MQYQVELGVFSGPLDLLLHLIEKQELDIYDIPIAIITEQYLQYIKGIQEIDLDNVSDFLLMAATLLSIKAKMLLPKHKRTEEFIIEDEDPREELVRHLLTYKKIKEAAEILKQLERQQRKRIARPIDKEKLVAQLFPDIPVIGLGFEELLSALANLLKKSEPEKVHLIERRKIFIEEQMKIIIKKINKSKRLLFSELFTGKPSIIEIIVTFLAVLQLSRLQKIRITQEQAFGHIAVVSRGE